MYIHRLSLSLNNSKNITTLFIRPGSDSVIFLLYPLRPKNLSYLLTITIHRS
ncbi:hypothetical protein KSS87_008074 [Heliosperma pusillum]|nr:hypothetical protein KSS87_008074 [Heliosperma pusillum]